MSKAEERFREAFERLKSGKPEKLPKGAEVSQNNVAKEAGRDPSALKRDRYPFLIQEIQAYVQMQEEEKPVKKKTDNRARTHKKQVADHKAQVEKLLSIVAAQDEVIVELLDQIEELKAGKVVRI